MCILNELDFLLKNKLFFKLQTEKSVSFFIAEVRPCTTWPRKICQKNHFIQNTLQLPLDILAQKFETLIQKYLSFCPDFLTGSLFVYVERFPVEHTAIWISVRKNVTKKRKNLKRVILDGLLSQFQVLPVFNPEVSCTTVCWFYITLSTCFLSPTTWCTNELRRLELAQISNSNKNPFDFLSTSHELIRSFLFEFTK